MKQTTIRRFAKPATAKWSLWALRFQARFYRQAGARRMAMLLHARHGRSSATVENRWLRSVVQVEPKVSLSFESSSGAVSISNVRQTRIRQAHVSMWTHLAMAQIMRREPMQLRGTAVAPRIERREIWTRLAGGTREIANLLELRFTELHHAGQRITERLIQRSTRARPAAVGERALTLRREPAAAVAPAAKAGEARMLEQERKTAALERTARPVMPAINVDQLVDQVIQQIDRRVIARRERLGRI